MIGKICVGILAVSLACFIPSKGGVSSYKKELLKDVIPKTRELKEAIYDELYTKFPNDISEKRISKYEEEVHSLRDQIQKMDANISKSEGENVDDISSLYSEILGHLEQVIGAEKGLIEIDKTEGLKESDYEITVNLYKDLEHEYEYLENSLIEKLKSKE